MGGFITGGTPTAQYEAGGSYAITAAFDNNTSTFWYANHAPPCWIKYDLGAGNAKTMTEYRMKKRGTEYHTPTAWKLYGSNDDSSYTELDSQTGQSFVGVAYKIYSVAVTTAYRYYKLDVSATTSNSDVELAEFTAWNGRPDDEYTVSLLHFNDYDGSTDFYDESGKIWTAYGDAQLDTAQKKWTASGLFDGNSDYISTPDHADFNMGAGDFTVDMWLRTATIGATQSIAMVQMGGVYSWLNLQRNTADLKFYMSANGAAWDIVNGTTIGVLVADTWYHVAIARSANDLYYFLNGTKIGTIDVTGVTFMDATGDLYVGASGTDQWWNGWIEELRISKGIARWTSDFTPPTLEYTPATAYYPPYLTDTDATVAPSINHMFPPVLADTDTLFIPSINHMFPPALSLADTFVVPAYGRTEKPPALSLVDTFVIPGYGRVESMPYLQLFDQFHAPLTNVPHDRDRIKTNLV